MEQSILRENKMRKSEPLEWVGLANQIQRFRILKAEKLEKKIISLFTLTTECIKKKKPE